MPLASNPYRVDGPLRDQDPFIGQAKLLAWIERSLRAGERFLAVYGLPKSGRTSLLQHLARTYAGRYLCVLAETLPPKEGAAKQLEHLQAELAKALRAQGRSWNASPSAAWAGLGEALADIDLLLLIDGISLYKYETEAWSPLLSSLDELVASANVHVLLAIEGDPAQAQDAPHSPLARLPSMRLQELTEIEVGELLAKMAGEWLIYDYDAVQSISRWTGGNPFLVQLFGHALFERVGHLGRADIHAVEQAAGPVLEAAGGTFARYWEALSPLARLALAAIGEPHGRHDLFTAHDILGFLRRARVQISSQEVRSALSELTSKGILNRLGADSYLVRAALLRAWLAREKPVPVVLLEEKRFRQGAPPPAPERSQRPVRWLSVLSWMMSALLVILIVLVWRGREQPSTVTSATATATRPRALPTATPPPTLPPKHIAYARRETPDGPWRIYAMLTDGSQVTPLTEVTSDCSFPRWSPDGRRLAFVCQKEGSRDIWAMDWDSKRLVNLTNHPSDDYAPAWSPKGDAIAFASYRDGNWEVYIMRSDGSRPTRLTNHPAADIDPTWSPDGERIAFASYRDGNWEIYAVNRDGSQLTRLTNHEATDLAPAWSPHGDLIAFESYRDGDMEIYTMAADGSGPVNLTNEPAANDHAPSWSPTGNELVYHSNRDGGWDIFRINLDGSGKVNLTRSEALEQLPTWQP